MKINVQTDLWHYLSKQNKADKRIVMYGMGNGADKILAVCEKYGIEISDFFASDGFVRGHLFHGKKVLSYTEVKEKYGAKNLIVLLSFASSLPEVLGTIYKVASECELYAPDVPVCGENLFCDEFYKSNEENIIKSREIFEDDESKRIFDNVVYYKLTGDIKYLKDAESSKDEVYKDILSAEDFEYAVDAGAYNGDTARELALYAPKLKKVYTLEPDRRNFKKLSQYAENETRFSVCAIERAAWDIECTLTYDASGNRNAGVGNPSAKKTLTVNATSIDTVCKSCERIDYVKYDVEGSEYKALIGTKKVIEKHRPALLVSAYHRSEDIFELPMLIRELYDNAGGCKLYLRRYPYVPAWDLNILAIPNQSKQRKQ